MKIFPVSDLHLELDRNIGKSRRRVLDNLNADEIDVLVLAGDIVKGKSLPMAKQCFTELCSKFKHVLYVPGNHDYWGGDFKSVDANLRACEAQISNLRVLRTGEVHEIEGQRFLGDTLWYPEPIGLYGMGFPGEDVTVVKHKWPDYSEIEGFEPEVYRRNQWCARFLREEVKEGDVVVTHMLPSWRSVAPAWQGSITNMFFVSDQSEVIVTNEPALWIHGHTHSLCDYVFHKTRVVCNPFGYPSDKQQEYRPDLVIEI